MVSTCPMIQDLSGIQDLPEVALVLWSCVPLLYCFALGALLVNMALFRVFRAFLARFYGVCVGLFGLGTLRGLCGFCARVELGGLKACGVFASIFAF